MKRMLCCALLLAAATAFAGERPVVLPRDFGNLCGTLLTPDGAGTGTAAVRNTDAGGAVPAAGAAKAAETARTGDAQTGGPATAAADTARTGAAQTGVGATDTDTAETAVLIIAGSGPTDRNGNSPLGVGGNSYKLLAEALADAGIASLRYDKRAIGQSVVDPALIPDLTLEEYIADAAALADWLAAQGYRKVVLAGHSEGALIALCAAQRSQGVAGVVSLAGAGYPLDEILRLQLAAQLVPAHPELMIEAEGIIAALKRGETVDISSHSQMLRGLFNPGVQAFIRSSFRYDPWREIRAVRVPVLIVGGGNDLQVTADNADALARAAPRARKTVIPGMTHMLKSSDDTSLEGQARTVYADPSLPLDTTLVRTVTRFIRELRTP